MPNWCNNHITLTHEDKSKIDAIMATQESQKGILHTILPCPEELNDPDTTTYSRGPEQEAREAKKQYLLEKYGYSSWYDWNIANWGTKWDLCEPQLTRIDDNTVEIACDTAWSPPIVAYQSMEEQGYKVRALYYEPGMCFAGIYEDGMDQGWSDWGDSVGARNTLPEELDEMFGISESQAEWEEEERREEELYRFVKDGEESRKAKLTDEIYEGED